MSQVGITTDDLLEEIKYLRRQIQPLRLENQQLMARIRDMEVRIAELEHPERAPDVEEWEGWG